MGRAGLVAGLVAAGAAVSLAAQEPASSSQPMTAGAVYKQVEDACAERTASAELSEPAKVALRQSFAVSDRMETRQTEARIATLVTTIDQCVSAYWDSLVVQRETDPARKSALATVGKENSTDMRLRQTERLRKLFQSFGYRPSSAPPGPRYGFCEINDDYEVNDTSWSHLYVSRVFVDRDPENEIADRIVGFMNVEPKTSAGDRILKALDAWAKQRWKPATERDWMTCQFYSTVREAQDAWEEKKSRWGDEFIETDVG